MSELGGRTVLITGGGRGIGREVAVAVAQAGGQAIVAARSRDELEETLALLPGEGHSALEMDVTAREGWPELDRLDGLVTAAGVLPPIGPVGSYEPDDFWRTVEINLLGTLLAVHHFLPALRSSRGSVVTFSGGGATGPLPRFDAYAASKAAVVRLSENLGRELEGDGVRVNCVAPGFVATAIHEATLAAGPELAGEEYYEKTRQSLAAGGVAARESAELVVRLLGGRDTVTGRIISARWDPWREQEFWDRLGANEDLATLRRIDDVSFAAR
jgi:NAD(P)-dependent dehydrogenase (short-subunit alcohol dehydrogenase family)